MQAPRRAEEGPSDSFAHGGWQAPFDDGILPATMRPVDLTTTDLGIVIGTYEPAGPVQHGLM